MKFTTLTTALLSTLATASPIDVRATTTSAQLSDFKISGDSSSVKYSTTITLLPDNHTTKCTHSTAGATIPPVTTGYWTCEDSRVWIRLNDSPTQNAYRVTVQDVRVQPPVLLVAILGKNNFPGGNSYTGPSSFTATGGSGVVIG